MAVVGASKCAWPNGEHRLTVLRRRPHVHVAFPGRLLHAVGQQVPGEDPLDRLVRSHVERHPNRIRIVGRVKHAGHQRHRSVLRDDKHEAELG
jgi:hypothetical protein